MAQEPLVTVAIPTYNRPDQLRHALSVVVAQTYRNLEILVSDNCSTVEGSEGVCAAFGDKRIVYFHQEQNIGPTKNFNFLLKRSRGDYFMWAADDDQLDISFVNDCMTGFCALPRNVVMVTKEVHYELDVNTTHLDFFAEGEVFRLASGLDQFERLKKVLEHGFGNLVYGLFKRSAMFWKGLSLLETIPFATLNEIPHLLVPAMHGEFVVLPSIGMRKKVPVNTYKQARWEYLGGVHPLANGWRYRFGVSRAWRYHRRVYLECRGALRQLLEDPDFTRRLSRVSQRALAIHYLTLLAGWKPTNPRVICG